MANRSTFNRDIPRNIERTVALSKTPQHYIKRQPVQALDRVTGAIRLDAEGKPFTVMAVLPDYDRMLRLLMKDAHAHHKSFKLKRLAKEVAAEVSKDADVADAA